MAYSPVAHATVAGANGGTTGSIDTTGATLLVAIVSWYNGGTTPVVTDSKSNTWVQIGTNQAGTITDVAMYYVASPTVGTGHTFTLTGSGSFSSMEIEAWSGSAASPLDQTSQAAAKQAGSVTPTQDNELLVAGIAGEDLSSVTAIDSGFTISDNNAYSAGNNEAGAMAYLVETTAAAKNPTWTTGGTAGGTATIIATFKAAAAAAAPIWGFDEEVHAAIRRRTQLLAAQVEPTWPVTVVASPTQFGWDNPAQFAKRSVARSISRQDADVTAFTTPAIIQFGWDNPEKFAIRRRFQALQPDEPTDQWPFTTTPIPAQFGWNIESQFAKRQIVRGISRQDADVAVPPAATQTPTQQGFAWEPQFAIRRRYDPFQSSDDEFRFTSVPTPTQFGWIIEPQFAERTRPRQLSKDADQAFRSLQTLTPTQQGFSWEPQFPIRRRPRAFTFEDNGELYLITVSPTGTMTVRYIGPSYKRRRSRPEQ